MAFTDAFTDTTGVFLEDHTPSGGTAWTRVDGVAGGARISSNRCASQTGGTDTAYWCDDQGNANQYVQYAVLNSTTSFICNRLTDAGNFIGIRRSSSIIQCFRVQGGIQTQLGSNGTTTVANQDVIKLESNGDVHTVYINGNLESGVGGTDSFNNTVTRQGIVCRNSSSLQIADDFEAGSLSTPGTEALSGSSSTGGQTTPSVNFSIPL